MRLLPRISSKQKIWPGGPEIGEVVQAQLSPPGAVAAAQTGPSVPPVGPAPLAEAMPAIAPDPAVELLLVLR